MATQPRGRANNSPDPVCRQHGDYQNAAGVDQLVHAKEVTYGDWYNDRLAIVTLEMADRTLSVSFHALITSFGLGWHMDVIADEFSLTDGHLQKQTDV